MPSTFRIRYNAPVILTFSLLAALVTILAASLGSRGGGIVRMFYVPGVMNWDNPLAYVRLFTHVLGHASWQHLMANLMIILLIGPLLEEKYGSLQLLEMIAITAGVTGALNILLFDTALLGASGVAFMLIVLSSLTSYRKREIPLTFVLVVLLFVGGEIAAAVSERDQVSQFTHIIGGACGAMLGLMSERQARERDFGYKHSVRITDTHRDQLLRHGYAIVPSFLTADELSAARTNFLRYFPTAEELHATPQRYGAIFEDPEHLQVEFPFASDVLNDVSTHPELVGFVERLLGTPSVLLSQAAIWAKYAGTGDFEQGLHLDYQGNTLVVPRDDGPFRQVNMILYYSDVGDEFGPTYVVSQEKTREFPLWPTHRTRKKSPELYRHEKPVLANAGDLLVFSMRTWHRASDMAAKSGARFSHHFVWRAADHAFQGYHQWSQLGEKPEMQSFIERATPRQREVLGFPKPGDRYWNDETLAAVRLRYPKMDLTPYR